MQTKTKLYLGVLSVAVTVVLALLVYFLKIPNPMMILIIPVVYFTYVGGWTVGLMSGGIAFLYSLYFFSNSGELFVYNSINMQKSPPSWFASWPSPCSWAD